MAVRRVRQDEEHWREIVQRCRKSGLTAAEFARRHKLDVKRLWYQIAKMARRDALAARESSNGSSMAKATFLPVVVGEAPAVSSRATLEVVLRSGHTIRIASGFDAAMFEHVIALLGGAT